MKLFANIIQLSFYWFYINQATFLHFHVNFFLRENMLTSCISFLLADLFLIMNYRTSLLAHHGSLTSFISMSQFPWVRSSLCLMVGLNFWAHKAENLVSKDEQSHKGITCLGTIAEFPTELLACLFKWKKKKRSIWKAGNSLSKVQKKIGYLRG